MRFAGFPPVGVGLEQLVVTDDDGQEVVEVVRDTAGELADGIHALRLPQRLLLLHLLGDVADEHHEAQDVAVPIAGRRGDDLGGEHLAVLAPAGHVQRIDRFFHGRGGEIEPEPVHPRIVIVTRVKDAAALADQLLSRIAEDACGGWITEKDLAALVHDDDGLRGAVDDRLEQHLLSRALGLGPPLRCQVMDDPGKVTLAVDLILADREMHGKGRAVLAQARHLTADTDDLALTGLQIVADIAVVLAPVGLGHEHLDVLPDQLG